MARDTVRRRYFVCGQLALTYTEHPNHTITLTVRCGEWEARASATLTPHCTATPLLSLLRRILRRNPHLRPFADYSGKDLILQEQGAATRASPSP